jgi:ABC-type branched-subunit amino acid transport system ATPase component
METGAHLEVLDALRTFGGINAVDHLSFRVDSGEVLGVIGPNGAGKTVLLNVICGVYPLDGGAIRLDGVQIDGSRPEEIAARGVARTFQSTEQFRDFRAIEYVMLSRHQQQVQSLLACFVRAPAVGRSEASERELAFEALQKFGLEKMAETRMSELPYGMQKLVDIARAVAAGPRLLLLDEPTSGTTSVERDKIAAVLGQVARSRVTMLVIDHDVSFIASTAQRVLVMNYGRLLAQGSPSDVLSRPEVIQVYLGL